MKGKAIEKKQLDKLVLTEKQLDKLVRKEKQSRKSNWIN